MRHSGNRHRQGLKKGMARLKERGPRGGGVHRGLTNAPHVKQFLHFKSQILLLIHGRPIVAHCQCGTQLHMLEFLLNVGNFVNKLLTASGIVLVVLIFGAISLDINKP